MSLTLSFLGGAGTVTGSRYLLERAGKRILVDCGLFQGLKQLRLRNWAPFPVEPRSVSAVILTHAHLDHSGYLPAFVRDGFEGPVYCSSATKDFCGILLPDSAHLQEQDAEYANRRKFSKHKPALPLYTGARRGACADASLTGAFRARPDDSARSETSLPPCRPHLSARPSSSSSGAARGSSFPAILGATTIRSCSIPPWFRKQTTCSSNPPTAIVATTVAIRKQALAEIIERTVGRGGTVVIPAFAVGRAQALLFHLERLKAAGKLRNVPIFLNSPMATDASDILCRHMPDQRLSEEACRRACGVARYVQSVEESKALNEDPTPKVIVSASGMATGGRVLHHLKRYAPDPRSTILFAGFQAAGTRGAAMVAGADTIKIHGEYIPVRAEVENLSDAFGPRRCG